VVQTWSHNALESGRNQVHRVVAPGDELSRSLNVFRRSHVGVSACLVLTSLTRAGQICVCKRLGVVLFGNGNRGSFPVTVTGPPLVTVRGPSENRPAEDRVTGGNRESAQFPVTVTGPPSVTVLRPTLPACLVLTGLTRAGQICVCDAGTTPD